MLYINHEKKAIFIHITKTGGSYIGPTLVKHYGFKSYLHLVMKRRSDHATLCQLHKFKNVITNNPKYNNSFFNKVVGLLVYCKTSDEINKECNMDEEKWNTYTKFCFIRNPYDRTMSGFLHMKSVFKHNVSFNNYITKQQYNVSDIEYGHVFMQQKKQIENVDGTCGVDIIGRFEHLEEDFVQILKKIGFEKIEHTPKKVNVSKVDTGDIIMDIESIKQLNKLLHDDLSLFHYKPICIGQKI